MLVDVVDTLEALTHVDGPGEGAHSDLQLLLQFIEDVERIATLAVELIDKDDHRRAAHATHLHQTACLRLDTLGGIHHDDHRVDCRQRAKRILGEVLVTRCVQNVDLIVAIVEPHHGGGD